MRGKYIVIEGSDGTGKSTQVKLLRSRLQAEGVSSIEFHEPEGTPVTDAIRTIIKDGTLARDSITNLLLFTAARHEIWKHASQSLSEGTWVISSRNYFSTLAYQGYGEGVDRTLILRTTQEFTDSTYMKPDLAVILTLTNEEERRTRIQQRGELHPDTFESRDATFQAAVKQGYLDIARDKGLSIIASEQTPNAITEQIYELIRKIR